MTTRIPFSQVFKASSRPSESDIDPEDFTPRDITPPPRGRQRANTNLGASKMSISSQPNQPSGLRGTRTPKMLEYERQAEERQREQDAMANERAAMQEEESKMQKERERIEREEYEMKQYYEAEALRHEQELKLHKEEVERHLEKVRLHERRIADHEASSEAFARVIAMPAQKGAGRQVSFYKGAGGKQTGSRNGSLDNGYLNGV